jgi:hypothetical protein
MYLRVCVCVWEIEREIMRECVSKSTKDRKRGKTKMCVCKKRKILCVRKERACESVCVRACVHGCVWVCVRACVCVWERERKVKNVIVPRKKNSLSWAVHTSTDARRVVGERGSVALATDNVDARDNANGGLRPRASSSELTRHNFFFLRIQSIEGKCVRSKSMTRTIMSSNARSQTGVSNWKGWTELK